MPQFKDSMGKFAKGNSMGGAFNLRFTKEGQWEECGIALNNFSKVGGLLEQKMLDIAWDIIVPCLDMAKESGDSSFAENADSTIRWKGHDTPWVGDGNNVTGHAIALTAGNHTCEVLLSGDQDIISYVDQGVIYNSWSGKPVPSRELFKLTWDLCENYVKEAVDAAYNEVMGAR